MRSCYLIPLLLFASLANAAEYRTKNFTVSAADARLAKQVGDAAEFHRAKHAREWLGKELPNWYAPCPINVKSGPNMGAGGATTFSFRNGEVFGWRMEIQGTPQDLIDSTVPHEVLHTIFACKFRRPIPRWADEGAATYVESESDKRRQRLLASQVMGTSKQIPIRSLLKMQEYPPESDGVAVLYAQGFYLVEYLVNQNGKAEFIMFLETYFKTGDWDTAFKVHYGFENQELAYTAAYRASNGGASVVADATPFDYDNYHIDYFSQEGCPPCRDFETDVLPVLAKTKIKVVKIDLSKSHNKERGKQDGIEGTPAFIVYKNGVKQQVIRRAVSANELLAACNQPHDSETVQVAQGVGIGYFGPVGGNKAGERSNPHRDFSAAQLQLLNQTIDQRAQLAIDNTISTRLDDLKSLMQSEIKTFVLEAQAQLTDSQKAMINATDSQKAVIAGFKGQVEAVEASKAEFIKATEAAQAENQKKVEALAAEVAEVKTENSTLKDSLKTTVVEAVKEHAPQGVVDKVSLAYGAADSFFKGGPIAVALYLGARVLARRKEDEAPAPAKK
ncbi:peptidase MA family metallohydrolase [Paremcibacter congregatus]|uniref:peptidase MA family metallohydrolase n=1 Tax=Paremcibacter congregatus TaxID=2043170 RepID=UPI003A91CEE0